MTALRLGTRGSALAMAQSGMIADAVRAATGREVELVEVVTAGDRSSAPVQRLGVGVFVSALRDALLAREIDFAVHSYKDLPTAPADGLHIAAVPEREDPATRWSPGTVAPWPSCRPARPSAPARCAGSPNCTHSDSSSRSPRSAATSTPASSACSARMRTLTRWCSPEPD